MEIADSVTQCRCGSFKVLERSVQTRSADEGSDFLLSLHDVQTELETLIYKRRHNIPMYRRKALSQVPRRTAYEKKCLILLMLQKTIF